MKAVVEVSPPNHGEGVQSGRVTKRRDVENEEVQMYISKLKDLVPFIPKNRRVSKVEVIEHVIQYICDLQYTLESRRSAKVDSAELVARLQGDVTNNVNTGNNRQPLGTLAPSPNTIVRSTAPSPPTIVPDTTRMSPTELEKTQDTDIRPISC